MALGSEECNEKRPAPRSRQFQICNLCHILDFIHIYKITRPTSQAIGKESHTSSTGQAGGIAVR